MYLIESGNKPANPQKAVREDEEAVIEQWEEQRQRKKEARVVSSVEDHVCLTLRVDVTLVMQ